MMTSDEYVNWCEAVSNTNHAMDELWTERETNYKWMANNLREFFNDLGKVISVKASNDGSVFRVRTYGRIKLDADAFKTLPFTFEVEISEDNDLMFYLYPDVEVTQED